MQKKTARPERNNGSLRSHIRTLGPWFHNIHFPDGTQTAPNHVLGDFPKFKWEQISSYLPRKMNGWSVLDIGCNAGFYCIELARRGAEVTGIDSDQHYLEQAAWAADQFGLNDRIHLKHMQVYDLAWIDHSYDIVLFMGVFYHLRYPLLAMDIVARKVKKVMVFQTLTMPASGDHKQISDIPIFDREALLNSNWPKAAFIEHSLAEDPTNWWILNHAGVQALLRSTGMRVTAQPGHEIYICKPDRSLPGWRNTKRSSEFSSATAAFYLHRRKMIQTLKD